MLKSVRGFAFLLTLLFVSVTSNATHYLGGDLTYEYIGLFNGQYRYEFQLDVYINKLPPSNFPTGNVDNLNLCIFDKSTNLPVLTQVMTNPFRVDIFPNLPPQCFTNMLNVRLNRFTTTCDLPGPLNEYYAVHESCCRDNNVNNLANPGNTGHSFYSDMSPNFVENSSPQFADYSVPYLCTGDTAVINNHAIDPDGDRLVFSLAPSRDQFYTGTAPGCSGPYNPAARPIIPFVNSGYTLNEPFGPGSYAHINSSNGITEYYAPNPGKYSLNIEIKEFRDINNDGIQEEIGTTTREIIYIVTTCSSNDKPEPLSLSINGQTLPIVDHAVDVNSTYGDTLSFELGFTDPNNDSLYMTASGIIIDSLYSFSGPIALFPSDSGLGNVSSTFTWVPGCLNYNTSVLVEVFDNACPSRYNYVVININPNNGSGQQVLNVCSNDTVQIGYNPIVNNVYSWNNNQNLNNLNISNPLYCSNQNGVFSDTLILTIMDTLYSCQRIDTFSVFGLPKPQYNLNNDDSICSLEPLDLGDSTLMGFSCTWSGLAVENPNQCYTSAAPINNSSSNQIVKYYLEIDSSSSSCAISDSISVIVKPLPQAFAGNDTTICRYEQINLGKKGVVDQQYSWSSTGLNSPIIPPNSSHPIQIVNDTGSILTYVSVLNINPNNLCSNSDTVIINIKKSNSGITISNSRTASQKNEISEVQLNNFQFELVRKNNEIYRSDFDLNNEVQILVQDRKSNCKDTLSLNLDNSEFARLFRYDSLNDIPSFFVEQDEIEEFEPLIANIVTPNGDGKNDTWMIGGLDKIPGTKVRIYNMENIIIYSSDDYNGDWNPQNYKSGTYFFILENPFYKKKYSGYLEVIR